MQRRYKSVKELLAQRPSGVYSVDVRATVLDALRVMAERNIGAVLVLDGEALAGILSERDYARKGIVAGRTGRETPVREMMTSEVVCVTPAQTVPQCVALMTDRRIRHLPVLEDGTPIGMLSIGDLVKEIISHHEHVIKAWSWRSSSCSRGERTAADAFRMPLSRARPSAAVRRPTMGELSTRYHGGQAPRWKTRRRPSPQWRRGN